MQGPGKIPTACGMKVALRARFYWIPVFAGMTASPLLLPGLRLGLPVTEPRLADAVMDTGKPDLDIVDEFVQT